MAAGWRLGWHGGGWGEKEHDTRSPCPAPTRRVWYWGARAHPQRVIFFLVYFCLAPQQAQSVNSTPPCASARPPVRAALEPPTGASMPCATAHGACPSAGRVYVPPARWARPQQRPVVGRSHAHHDASVDSTAAATTTPLRSQPTHPKPTPSHAHGHKNINVVYRASRRDPSCRARQQPLPEGARHKAHHVTKAGNKREKRDNNATPKDKKANSKRATWPNKVRPHAHTHRP